MKKPQTAPVAKQVVLIIDDDPTVRSSLKFSLEVEGFTVRAKPFLPRVWTERIRDAFHSS